VAEQARLRPGRILAGLVLVALGTLFLADRLSPRVDVWGVIGDWWPLVIIAAGVLQLIHSSAPSFPSVVVILVGAVLLVDTLDLIEGTAVGLWWPIVLIAIGFQLLYRGTVRRSAVAKGQIDALVLFSERDIAPTPGWRAGGVTVVFGGATIDLRTSPPAQNGARLRVTAVLGGVDVLVPQGWQGRVAGFPILGSVRDGTQAGSTTPPVTVTATAVFGRVEIRHQP
jgi:predicted membrane protein